MIKNKQQQSKRQVLRNFAIFKLKEKRIRIVNGSKVSYATTKDLFLRYKELYGIDVEEGFKQHKKQKAGGFRLSQIKDRIEKGFVYFIINEQNSICKIGYSVSPANRLKELQTSCPYTLHIQKTVVGDIKMERLFHKIYKEYNINGEWFSLKGELKSFVFSNR